MDSIREAPVVHRERDLRSIVPLIWRRRWVILLPALAGLVTGIVISHPKIMKPVYRASSTLLFEFSQPVTRDLQGVLPAGGMQGEFAFSRLQSMMQSNDFLLKVADQTGLRQDPTLRQWVSKSRKRYPDMTVAELQDLHITRWLRSAIRVGSGKTGQNLIVISVADNYPDRARLLAQNLTNAVIQANTSAQLERVRSLHDFSLEQLALYKDRLSDAEKKLDDYQKGINTGEIVTTLVTDGNVLDVRGRRARCADELGRFVQERDALQTALESRSPNTFAVLRSAAGGAWTDATQEVKDLERRYAEQSAGSAQAEGTGSETTALVIARKIEDLSTLASSIVSDEARGIPTALQPDAAQLLVAEARVAAVTARRDAYDRMLQEYAARATGTSSSILALKRLADNVEANRSLCNAFVQQLASTQISEAFEATKAATRLTVIEPASRPLTPIKPNRPALVVLCAVMGLLLGLGALVLVERHDVAFRDVREAEAQLGLRVVGALPQIEEMQGGRKGNGVLWTPAGIESFLKRSPTHQELRRIAIQLRGRDANPVKSLLVTSARAGEGKTTTSILLAATLASERPEEKVLLLEVDFRRSSLARILGLEEGADGVAQALETGRFDERMAQATLLPNLYVLPLGPIPTPRHNLPRPESLSWLVPELLNRYGFVIIDSAPNLPIPDSLVIGQHVDAVLFVVRAGSTPRHMVERAIELQKQFKGNLWGVLMNYMDEVMPSYYDYRRYGYSYGAREGGGNSTAST